MCHFCIKSKPLLGNKALGRVPELEELSSTILPFPIALSAIFAMNPLYSYYSYSAKLSFMNNSL